MPIDWPTIIAFVVVEALFVLIAAPVLIQRKNEARAVVVFKQQLLPLMPKPPTADELAAAVKAALPLPSTEDQAAARAQLAGAIAEHVQAAVPVAVQGAIAEAVKGRMGALSAQGVDARASKALNENALKARVGEKYGLKGLGALAILKNVDKSVYELGLDAVSFAPGSLDEWLEQHAEKFTIGAGGATAGKRVQVI